MRTRPDLDALTDLRRHLAAASLRDLPAGRDSVESGQVGFGAPALDGALAGGIARAALHEIYAPATADLVAAAGFAIGLALRAAGPRPILWVRQDAVDVETGRLHPPGLTEFGLDPDRVLLVRARDAEGVLRAGGEAARCSALGAVLIEPWGQPHSLDLTASRRLSLAAEGSGAMTLLLRAAVTPQPSAARTRWLVAGLPSRALEANAPGYPAFSLRLLRHRGGLGEQEWCVEWNRDRQSFEDSAFRSRPAAAGLAGEAGRNRFGPDAAPLSGAVVSFPADRPAETGGEAPGIRRTG